jgi:hypothetical protein
MGLATLDLYRHSTLVTVYPPSGTTYQYGLAVLAQVTAPKPIAGKTPGGTITWGLQSAAAPDFVYVDSTLTKGWAQRPAPSMSVGRWVVSVAYSGDMFYKPPRHPVQAVFTIVPASTDVALSSTANPAARGTAQSLVATVTSWPGTVPTGTVTFFEKGRQVGSPIALDSHARALLPLNTFSSGPHQMTATYSGSSNFNPSAENHQFNQRIT